jgi:hypothetical protein
MFTAVPMKGLAGRSPTRPGEKPYTNVRNLTDTTRLALFRVFTWAKIKHRITLLSIFGKASKKLTLSEIVVSLRTGLV